MRQDGNVTVSPGMAWVAGLPVLGCMLVMGVPSLADPEMLGFRLFYTLAYLAWIVPLGWMQRMLWRRGANAWAMAGWLLPLSYAMSVANALFALEFIASPAVRARADWTWVFGGLDGCWLALIAFCGMQAVLLHRAELHAEGARLREAAHAARDAELRALRYQLQPHFLFNTLNAISTLVSDDRKRDAARMIARLGDFLRVTLEASNGHEVSVADEIAFTSAYLDIEQVRFGDRLRVDIQTGPDTLDARVPSLLLQPLVENAIRHGIAPRADGGRIGIRFERDGAVLKVVVDNDRVGTPSTVAGQGVGLTNVRARLHALHASECWLDVVSYESLWRVTVTLPWRVAEMEAAR